MASETTAEAVARIEKENRKRYRVAVALRKEDRPMVEERTGERLSEAMLDLRKMDIGDLSDAGREKVAKTQRELESEYLATMSPRASQVMQGNRAKALAVRKANGAL